jgi:hypothetical protein
MAVSTSSTARESRGAGPPERPTAPTMLCEFLTRKIGNLRFLPFFTLRCGGEPRLSAEEGAAFWSKIDKNCRIPTSGRRRECPGSRVPGSLCADRRRSEVSEVGSRGGAMDAQIFGVRRFPRTSALLASSAGLGWSTLSAELRSHGVSEAPTIVPQHVEIILVVAGNQDGLVRRTGPEFCQEAAPRTGAIWLSPAGVGKAIAITAPIPQTMHLHLPATLFDRLKDDSNLPSAPALPTCCRHA